MFLAQNYTCLHCVRHTGGVCAPLVALCIFPGISAYLADSTDLKTGVVLGKGSCQLMDNEKERS